MPGERRPEPLPHADTPRRSQRPACASVPAAVATTQASGKGRCATVRRQQTRLLNAPDSLFVAPSGSNCIYNREGSTAAQRSQNEPHFNKFGRMGGDIFLCYLNELARLAGASPLKSRPGGTMRRDYLGTEACEFGRGCCSFVRFLFVPSLANSRGSRRRYNARVCK